MKEFGMYIQRLIFSDKMENLLSVCVRLLLTVIIGLIIIRIIMKITRKFLDRSSADPSVYAFVKNSVKITCLVVLVTMCMGILGIPMSTVVAVLGAAGAASCAGSQGQPCQYSRGNDDNNNETLQQG